MRQRRVSAVELAQRTRTAARPAKVTLAAVKEGVRRASYERTRAMTCRAKPAANTPMGARGIGIIAKSL